MKLFKILFVLVALASILLFCPPTINGGPKKQALAQPLLSYTPEPYVPVLMYALSPAGAQRTDTNGNAILCDPDPLSGIYKDFGCTAFCDNKIDGQPDPKYNGVCGAPPRAPVYPYPYEKNPIVVPMQTYYLLDVLSSEMSPGVVKEPQALRAQSITSRSFAWNLFENRPDHTLRNSNSDQVYIPYKYDSLYREVYPLEPNTPDPCAFYIWRNASQQRACTAVSANYYVAWWGNDVPAQANFQADSFGVTLSGDKPYLEGISDPISTACNTPQLARVIGLSTSGAMRWSRGHECSYDGAPPAPGNSSGRPWSVTWTTAEQILFHYYTGVHLRDADNDKKILSPDWRWNPLKIEWETQHEINGPPVMTAGQTHVVPIQIQNTGIDDWACRIGDDYPGPRLSYRLRYRWLNGSTVIYTSTGIPMCNVPAGSAKHDMLQVYVPPGLSGLYTLRLDMYEALEDFWFSDGGWPPYDVTIRIIPSTPTPTATSCGFDGC